MDDREKCLIAWQNYDQTSGSMLDWHYFKRAWDICSAYGKLQYNESGQVNYNAVYAVIEGMRTNIYNV